MNLVEMVYRYSAKFPKQETYGMVAQLRRAAISVPSNLAEGAARNSPKELLQYVGIASGSLAELETQLEVAVRLGYLDAATERTHQVSYVGRLLVGLRNALKRKGG